MNSYNRNIAIRELIRVKDEKNEIYTEEDLTFISEYEGKGGFGSQGDKGEGLLYEFFTPSYVVDLMWELARFHGYFEGSILEPSCGTGRFFKNVQDKSLITGFEIDPTAFRIAQLLYPEAQLFNNYFETAFLLPPRFTERIHPSKYSWLDGSYSLVIGNPPYGKHTNRYSSYFKRPKMAQMELFFIYQGLRLLRPGGLLVYITSSNILRNGLSYNQEKEEIGKWAELIDAYRLPPVFKSSQVPTDIIILKRK